MDINTWIDELLEAESEIFSDKEKHRRSRVGARKEKDKAKYAESSLNSRIGQKGTKWCKRAMHKKNRRNNDIFYNKGDYALKTRYFDMT